KYIPKGFFLMYATPSERSYHDRDLLLEIVDNLNDATRNLIMRQMQSIDLRDDSESESGSLSDGQRELTLLSVNATSFERELVSNDRKPSVTSSGRRITPAQSTGSNGQLSAPTEHSTPHMSLGANSVFSHSAASRSPLPRASSQIPQGSYLASIIGTGSARSNTRASSTQRSSASGGRPLTAAVHTDEAACDTLVNQQSNNVPNDENSPPQSDNSDGDDSSEHSSDTDGT
ncbi:hypothetical protein FRC04_000854, partial [Tulasnella sp. 424]